LRAGQGDFGRAPEPIGDGGLGKADAELPTASHSRSHEAPIGSSLQNLAALQQRTPDATTKQRLQTTFKPPATSRSSNLGLREYVAALKQALAALEHIRPEQIDVRRGHTLPALIESTLHVLAEEYPKGFAAKPRTRAELANALRERTVLIPEELNLPKLQCWFGEVDLAKLNDVGAYLDAEQPEVELMRDLWIAHASGLVPIELSTTQTFNNPKEIKNLIVGELKRSGRSIKSTDASWHDRLVIGHALSTRQWTKDDRTKGGQIQFAAALYEKGMITITNLQMFHNALAPKWATRLRWNLMQLRLDQAILWRDRVQKLARVPAAQRQHYAEKAGFIRFVAELHEAGKITSTNLRHLFGALDRPWTTSLGWSNVYLPLSDAMVWRAAVQALVEGPESNRQRYLGAAGLIRLATEMRDAGSISSTNLRHLYSALDRAWASSLDWSHIDLPLKEAIAWRAHVQRLVDLPEGERGDCTGAAAFIRIAFELHETRAISSTNLDQLRTALDKEWVRVLKWSQVKLPLQEATAWRAAVATLVEGGESTRSRYLGKAGLIRYVTEMRDSGTITSTNLGNLCTALDEPWMDTLKWNRIGLSLDEAVAWRTYVKELVEAPASDRLPYSGKAGLIRVVSELRGAGTIASTSLSTLFRALDAQWIDALQWGFISMPVEEALEWRACVQRLIDGPESDRQPYIGTDGRIRLVTELLHARAITTSNLGQLHSALDADQAAALSWKMTALPLLEASGWRARVRELIDGSTEDKGAYLGSSGFIRLAADLHEARVLTSTHLSSLHGALDEEWAATLGWPKIRLTLDAARRVLRTLISEIELNVQGGALPSVDGVPYRVALDSEGQVRDWFDSDGLPRRLQRFTGTIVGYRIPDADQPVVSLRLRRPLGYAAYAFARYTPDGIRAIDITLQDGIPSAFRIWSDDGVRTLSARYLLSHDTLPSGAYQYTSDDGREIEAVEMSALPENTIENQIVAQSIRALLTRLYGQEQGLHVLEMFVLWDRLTQDEGWADIDAYREVESRHGVSKEQYMKYKAELARALSREALDSI